MRISQGDEVILPGFTCIVVPNAIIYLGAKPVYVDINSETFNIDPQLIEENITEKTKAIIAQHTFGIPADMDKILHIANKHNLFVIEDSCHALGSKYKGKYVGSFGDAAFFSSQWSKP
ncbi:MAG: DegT/DnrJ/EryC1/StrS family aminotransferase, partial [Cytophagaceae bacterium]